MRKFYNTFVTELKNTNPSKWYSMAKKIGAVNQSEDDDLKVEVLAGLTDEESAEQIASHFASVSRSISHWILPNFHPSFLHFHHLRLMNLMYLRD